MATANAATAAQRHGPASLCRPGASATRNHTKNGTSAMRIMVRTLGRFQTPARRGPAAVASVLVTFLGYLPGAAATPAGPYRPVSDQASSEPSSSSPYPPGAESEPS